MDGYIEQLQLQCNEEDEKLNRQKLELNQLSTQIRDYHRQLYNLRLENEQLLSLQERQIKLQNRLSEEVAGTTTSIYEHIEHFDGRVHDVLTDYDSQQEEERKMVLQCSQSRKDLPNAYSSETIEEKVKGIELQMKEISEMIEVEYADFEELKDKFKSEDTNDPDTLDAFITEIKKIIVELNFTIPKH